MDSNITALKTTLYFLIWRLILAGCKGTKLCVTITNKEAK